MARDLSRSSPRYLSTLFDVGVTTGLTDGQLLERFATEGGEVAELAFSALVDRHGPMVLGACRRILHDDHEAMDAFQATFLVLVRKRGSLWARDSLGPWLHRVAVRAAGRAKAEAGRRQALERRSAEISAGRPSDGERDDLIAILHEEVDRLPDRYRASIVLCELEGRTCAEAAGLLGCPAGTVAIRLSRARDRLRCRLARRGQATGVVALGAVLHAEATGADVPPALVISTTRIAVLTAAGRVVDAAIPSAVIALAGATLRTTFMTKLMLTIAGLLVASIIVAGIGVLARPELGKRARGGRREVGGPNAPAAAVSHADAESVQDRPLGGPDLLGPTLLGKIVVFGEGDVAVPATYRIRALDPDAGTSRTIAEFSGHAWSGRVSPDGRRIAFMLPPHKIEGDKGIHLCVMDAGGRNRENLVKDAAGAVACWSPDGDELIYIHQGVRNERFACASYLVNLSTKKVVRLDFPGNEIVTDWSPDGSEWLISTLGTPPDPDPKQFQIYRVKKDGAARVRLGDRDTGNSYARFSPDGRRVAYLAGAPFPTETRRSQVRVVDREGGRARVVLEGDRGASFNTPCWSPDGKRIAVVSAVPGDTMILVVDAENGGPARRLTPRPKNRMNELTGEIDWR